MKIALRFNRPVVGEAFLGLSRPLYVPGIEWRTEYLDGGSAVQVPVDVLKPISEFRIQSQVVEIDMVAENVPLVAEWTAKDEDGKSMFDFHTSSDLSAFEMVKSQVEKAKAESTPATTTAEKISRAKAKAAKEQAEAEAAKAELELAEAEAQQEWSDDAEPLA